MQSRKQLALFEAVNLRLNEIVRAQSSKNAQSIRNRIYTIIAEIQQQLHSGFIYEALKDLYTLRCKADIIKYTPYAIEETFIDDSIVMLESEITKFEQRMDKLSSRYAETIIIGALITVDYDCERTLLERHQDRLYQSITADFKKHWRRFDCRSVFELNVFCNQLIDIIASDIVKTNFLQRWSPSNWSYARLCLHHKRSKQTAPEIGLLIANYPIIQPLFDIRLPIFELAAKQRTELSLN